MINDAHNDGIISHSQMIRRLVNEWMTEAEDLFLVWGKAFIPIDVREAYHRLEEEIGISVNNGGDYRRGGE